VKAGAVPLHVWLPLAHPVAPTPASAILSGALINAGLLGWLRFLPLGETALPGLGTAVALIGVVTVFYGAGVGVTQRDAKTVLAYSSISQMGFMITTLGVALSAPSSANAARAALVVFALHHSVAKGTLFLGTAIASPAGAGWPKWLTRACLVLPALAIAGAPLTSGAAAKAAVKEVFEGGPAFLHPLLSVLSIGAVGSTLLMARFLGITLPSPALRDERPPPGLWLPWAFLLLTGNTLFFIQASHSRAVGAALAIGKLWSASWPILVATALVYAVRRARRSDDSFVTLPAGDLVVVFERELQRIRVRLSAIFDRARLRDWPIRVSGQLFGASRRRIALERIERTEAWLGAFGVIGVLTVLLLGLLARLLFR
jgi:multicomponent Na+:H+ antiporter subunit D